jgi:hypothetical protein
MHPKDAASHVHARTTYSTAQCGSTKGVDRIDMCCMKPRYIKLLFKISQCFGCYVPVLGDSPASEIYMTFRNTTYSIFKGGVSSKNRLDQAKLSQQFN